MALVNENYTNLKETYLFADIARKVNAFAAANPDKKIIRLGIGDVTLPLAACVVEAMEKQLKKWACKLLSVAMVRNKATISCTKLWLNTTLPLALNWQATKSL